MENIQAVDVLGALAQLTRLRAYRALLSREPDGISAGELAHVIEVPQNTLSAHLSVMSNAGLVTAERRSRSIIYRADVQAFQRVALFLLEDCCRGRPEICAPVIKSLKRGRSAAKEISRLTK
ncbi:ArsR/SmtB family transcription factor [Bradyrhizobium genosp. P]|uniref:ArsR/SmtB family transcription factor n=1 Tax=Bradyrhizobium genosp. P TaxID=83641 RepID=UPI003CF3EE2B